MAKIRSINKEAYTPEFIHAKIGECIAGVKNFVSVAESNKGQLYFFMSRMDIKDLLFLRHFLETQINEYMSYYDADIAEGEFDDDDGGDKPKGA